jgi:hypothetical protein
MYVLNECVKLCDIVVSDINECASNPCENGGTCNNLANQFSCTCAARYTGVTCKICKWIELHKCHIHIPISNFE